MEKLTIKNFGPIKDATIDLKKVNVFIGPQGSGKSTIAKLVAICREPSFLLDDPTLNHQFYKDYRVDGFFNLDTVINYDSPSYQVNVSNNPLNHDIKINEHFKMTYENQKDRYELALKDVQEKSPVNNKSELESLVERERYLFYQLRSLKNRISTIPFYVPTERFLVSLISDSNFLFSDSSSLPKALVNFGAAFQQIRNNATSYFKSNILNVAYKFEGGKDRIYHNDSEFVNLSDGASGYQAVIPLEIIVSFFTNDPNSHAGFIVEEPELNLFPEAQKKLIYQLVSQCSKGENEIIFTTHSPYTLSSLNTLLFAWKVATKFPERSEEINSIIPKESWINPDEFSAYYVADGTVKSIIDDSTGMIGDNSLDDISNDLNDEFGLLMSIYSSKKAA